MNNYVISNAATLVEIADAIRETEGSTDKLSLSQFSTSIKGLGGAALRDPKITAR